MDNFEKSIVNFLLELMNDDKRNNINIKDKGDFLIRFDSRQPKVYFIFGIKDSPNGGWILEVTRQNLTPEDQERHVRDVEFGDIGDMKQFIFGFLCGSSGYF